MALSGLITVTTAGTQVQGDDNGAGTYVFTPNGANSGAYIYIGDDSVASTNGYQLGSGEQLVLVVTNLSHLWFDATTSGDKVRWIKIAGEQVGVNPPAI